MRFFFQTKRYQLFHGLRKAFPKELESDVKIVCHALTVKRKVHSEELYIDALCSNEFSEWQLFSGEKIKFPYRIYISDTLFFPIEMTERQRLIYHCIFSRSSDGYIRQKHLEALLDSEPPEWVLPYIIKLCDEYVKEILETVYEKLNGRNCEIYKALCALNFDYFTLGHCRMISYWNEYYRNACYRYKDYIGKKLYEEYFGYRKTGQKSIQF